tara:strand:- start:1032 stop:1376 length:345 start_codon:yes stop_codon:yes gene_type:complete
MTDKINEESKNESEGVIFLKDEDVTKLNNLIVELDDAVENEYSVIKEFYTLVSNINPNLASSVDVIKTCRMIVDSDAPNHFGADKVADITEDIKNILDSREKFISNRTFSEFQI